MEEGKVYFSWQNPILRESIYPFRKKKLLDFILTYEEIDKLAEARQKGDMHPEIVSKLQEIRDALQSEHHRIADELHRAIDARVLKDKWLAKIKDPDAKKLRFKRIYYIDRMIVDWTNKLAERQGMRDSLLKRVNWYPEGDSRRQRWIDRAREHDGPIAEANAELNELKKIRELYNRQDRLPKLSAQAPMTVDALVRWEMLDRRNELDKLSHSTLMEMVLDLIKNKPEHFRPWLAYMVIHFSGMRYKSAHGSWADPRFILMMLIREFLEDEVREMDPVTLTHMCDRAASDLGAEKAITTSTRKVGEINRQIRDLTFFNRPKGLLAYRTDIQLRHIENMNDDQVVERLSHLRDTHIEDMPAWVWQEIEKYTPLKLTTEDKNWEAISTERWKYEDRRWTEILNIWETQDITGWRAKHRDSLELVVTRAVCNEIAEHIQHLRGVTPGAGLTAKPRFYYGQAQKTLHLPDGDPKKAYFKYPASEKDFRNGASILWMGYSDRPPNPWQVIQAIPGFDFPTSEGGDFGFMRWTHEATVVGVADMLDGKYVLTFETGQIGLILRRMDSLVKNPNVLVGYVPEDQLPPDKVEQLNNMVDEKKILAI